MVSLSSLLTGHVVSSYSSGGCREKDGGNSSKDCAVVG